MLIKINEILRKYDLKIKGILYVGSHELYLYRS